MSLAFTGRVRLGNDRRAGSVKTRLLGHIIIAYNVNLSHFTYVL